MRQQWSSYRSFDKIISLSFITLKHGERCRIIPRLVFSLNFPEITHKINTINFIVTIIINLLHESFLKRKFLDIQGNFENNFLFSLLAALAAVTCWGGKEEKIVNYFAGIWNSLRRHSDEMKSTQFSFIAKLFIGKSATNSCFMLATKQKIFIVLRCLIAANILCWMRMM